LIIGGDSGSESARHGSGWIDDVAIYAAALSGAAVLNHYVAGTPPRPPTQLVTAIGNAQVGLQWANNSEPDLAGYDVYRATVSGGPYVKLNGSLLTAARYTDTTAVNGTTYYYVVRAIDTDANASPNSSEVSAKPYASSYRDAVTSTAGLVSYWRLGESSGTTAVDQLLRNPGTYSGGVTLGEPGVLAGDPDKAVRLDGTSGVMTVPTSASLDPNSITVELWARSSGATWNQTGWLASKRDKFVLHPWAGSKQVCFYVQTGGGSWQAPVCFTPADITIWHQYAGTYDAASGKLTLYLDGIAVDSRTVVAASLNSSANDLIIGGDSGSESARHGSGWIDDVAIYAAALSGAAVLNHYVAGT
jgi:hypothetical protein